MSVAGWQLCFNTNVPSNYCINYLKLTGLNDRVYPIGPRPLNTLSSSVLMLHWTLFKLSLMDSFDCSITKIQSRMAPVCHINTYYWIIIAYLMHHCVNRILKGAAGEGGANFNY